jgi:hypothetical protein
LIGAARHIGHCRIRGDQAHPVLLASEGDLAHFE